jgi:hypothetical protein
MKLPEKILLKDVEAYRSDVLRFIYYSQGTIDGGDEPNISERMVASTSEPTTASMGHGPHITRQRQTLRQEKQHTSSQVNQPATGMTPKELTYKMMRWARSPLQSL